MNPKAKRKKPMQEIAENYQHMLLLKQWMKEEAAICRRISIGEARLDTTRKQATQLCIFFFLYHAIVLILLYSTVGSGLESCRKAWIPYLQSVAASVVMILGIRYKMGVEKKAERLVDREKKDARLLGKCIEELKSKGKSFDLLEEVESLRRAKNMWVGSNRDGGGMSGRVFVTLFLIVVEGFVLGFIRLVLCDRGI